jgi:membrane protease YdiL (CAAX protease family)
MSAPSTTAGAARSGYGWAFIGLAGLGRNTLWSYIATLLRVVLLPLAFLALGMVALVAASGTLRPGGGGTVSAAVIALAVAAVVVAGLALVWGVVRSHRRPWRSLITADLRLDWRRLAIGAAVEATLLGLTVALGHWLAGQPWPSGSSVPLPALAAILLLIPFQAASEEMLFRGYLTQALGRLSRHRSVIVLVVGVVFGALHFNAYGALTLPYILLLSLIFSLVSLRDERLELVIGAHTANNWVAFGAFDLFGKADLATRLAWPALMVLVVNGALFYAGTRLLVERFCQPRSAR